MWSSSRSQCCSCVNIHELLHLFSPAAGVDANDIEKTGRTLWSSWIQTCEGADARKWENAIIIFICLGKREKKETNMVLFTVNDSWATSTRNISSLATLQGGTSDFRGSRTSCVVHMRRRERNLIVVWEGLKGITFNGLDGSQVVCAFRCTICA